MLPASYSTTASVVLTVGGLLSCFAGYRLFRLVLGLYGFIVGASVTMTFMGPSHPWTMILAAVVGGLCGAVLMIAAYFVGVGLVGAGLAAVVLRTGWAWMAHSQPPTAVLVVVCVLGALGALKMVRYVVIFGTALAGSWTLLVGGLSLLGDKAAARAASSGDVWLVYPLDPLQGRWWVLALWFVVALAGVVVQMATSRRGSVRKAKPSKETK